MISGKITDIQPNNENPTLELKFSAKDRHSLPRGQKAKIDFEIMGAVWSGTINSEHSGPYVHTNLFSENGGKISCTSLFLSIGLKENAELIFQISEDGVFRLIKIASYGKWREGNEYGVRSNKPNAPSKRTEILKPQKQTIVNPEKDDLARLIFSLKNDFPVLKPSTDKAWSRPLALRIIDCVLSLNRNYDSFVVPRLDAFEEKFPDVMYVRDLHELISRYDNPADFMALELNYYHPYRARILFDVVEKLIKILGNAHRKIEAELLEKWAKNAHPQDAKSEFNIDGFALAGFQYLRMLLGANTSKPDKHMINYVSNAVGHLVSADKILALLESAAEKLDISLRDLDTNIWERSSRGQD